MSALNSILGSILRAGLSRLGHNRLPKIDGVLGIAGLQNKVEIIRDRWGVPHIYASSNHDLFFAQGYVHAQDRLFQMELNRRTAQGCLSELFGAIALDTDRTTRTFGFNRLGKVDWESASVDIKETILAYTQGVNAYLEYPGARLPVEFTLLGRRPEPWIPEDTTAFSRVMMWQLSHAWYGEIVRAQIAQEVGEEHAAELEIQYPDVNPITLPNGIEFNLLNPDGSMLKASGPFLKRAMGSNAWAVTGRKSVSGKPYLCNDMHLAMGIPSLWYEVHLVGEHLNVAGVTLPGIPGVLVGHNASIAWGMTLAFTDCEDLFVEEFDPKEMSRYRYKGEWRQAEIAEETIRVKGRAEPHIEKVVITHHGPVISDVVSHPTQRLAVNSMALRPSTSITAWLMLNRARNWNEFVEAMHLIEAPQLSVCYADIEGNIGYWVTGKVPVRAKGDGSVPVPGWTGEYEWIGEVPFEEMPHTFNPEQGYVVTCNHRIVPKDYPYFLGNVWMNGYRARRIEEVFKTKEKLGVEDFRRLHVDFTCTPGLEFVSRIQDLASDDADVQLAMQLLRNWDGILSPNSVGGCIYEVARYTLIRNIIEPGLGPELALRWMGQGFHPLLLSSHEFYGHDTVTLLRLLDKPESWWIVQAGGREAVLTSSLKQAVEWLRDKLGNTPASWQWGKLHRALFPHPLGIQKPLDLVFNRGPVSIGGDTDTPCQTAFQSNAPYDNNSWAPTFRQIVDMGDLSKSIMITPPGQSGHLASSHYDDMIQPWINGEYHPLLWTREQVESEAEGRLNLIPG